MGWEVKSVEAESDNLKELLSKGWEPFAVTHEEHDHPDAEGAMDPNSFPRQSITHVWIKRYNDMSIPGGRYR